MSVASPSSNQQQKQQAQMIALYKIPTIQKLKSSGLSFKQDETIQHTREWFARVIVDPELLASFGDYVEKEHCSENLQFYTELTKLEDRVAAQTHTTSMADAAAYESARSAGSTHALARFLRAAATATSLASNATLTPTSNDDVHSSTSSPSHSSNPTAPKKAASASHATALLATLPPLPPATAPQGLIPSYVELFRTYIAQGAPQEINVTDANRRRIAASLKDAVAALNARAAGGTAAANTTADLPGFQSNVFDPAGDEIVDLLYRDTFKRFVAFRMRAVEEQVTTPQTGGAAAGGSEERLAAGLSELDGETALMLLAQAAINAEREREREQASQVAVVNERKRTPFWRKLNNSSTANAGGGAGKEHAHHRKGDAGSSAGNLSLNSANSSMNHVGSGGASAGATGANTSRSGNVGAVDEGSPTPSRRSSISSQTSTPANPANGEDRKNRKKSLFTMPGPGEDLMGLGTHSGPSDANGSSPNVANAAQAQNGNNGFRTSPAMSRTSSVKSMDSSKRSGQPGADANGGGDAGSRRTSDDASGGGSPKKANGNANGN
ncbi:hypothetical protein HK101_001674, partial [Irineochytrium annulatum]